MEPMEIDTIENELEDKENFHHGNFVAKTSCTEKGYEELDVSELNMKLRYSITPGSSPMSKSVTINCTETKNYDRGDNSFFNSSGQCNMSKSLNSTVTLNDTVKSLKTLPLQPLPSDHFSDGVKQLSRPLDTQLIQCVDVDNTVSPATRDDENFSLPSSSSSMVHTPEATTPTKEISKQDGGSPILRGLKSVLSMFRTSQSPVNNEKVQNDDLTPASSSTSCIAEDQQILASTPISTPTVHSKVSSFRESIVFKDDLEKELQWKDDPTIIFSQERVPAHKLFPDIQLKAINKSSVIDKEETKDQENLDGTTMSMDISLYFNDCSFGEVTMAENNKVANMSTVESDNEFVDCETTFKEESTLEENADHQNANLTKNIDVVKEIKSVSSDVVNESTLNVHSITESELSSSRVDEENESQLHFNNNDTICNPDPVDIPLKVSHDAEDIEKVVMPDCVKVIPKAEDHNDTTLNDIDIFNKSVHSDRPQAESLRPDTNVKSEDVVSQANITLSNEENTSIKHSTKNIKDDVLQTVYSQYETDLVKQENKQIVPALDNNAGNYGEKEFETKEIAELEHMNYNMSMTNEPYENDTTINVISNIDTFFRDNDNNMATKPNNILPKITSNLHVNVPLPDLDDFVVLNDSISVTKPLSTPQDKIIAIATDMSDKHSDYTINNEPIIGCSLEEVKELTGNDVIEKKVVGKECEIDNLDEITKVSIEDKTIQCTQTITDIEDQLFQDIQENYENQNLTDTQVNPSKDACCKDKSLRDNKTDVHVKEENDLEITTNSKSDIVFNSETIDKLTVTSEEEIIVSENNSPYVSLFTKNVTVVDNKISENLEEIVNPFTTESKITSSPPISPKIQSKGYNFNFDEIDDPFATKTKIRLSPPLDDVNTTINIEKRNDPKTKPTNKVKSPPKKPKTTTSHFKTVLNNDLKENLSTVKAQCSEVYESTADTVPTKVIFTAKNFDSLSSSTFDMTNDLDENKSKEDLFHGQNSETFSSTTFNITADKSSKLEIQDLQEKLDLTIVLSTNTHSQATETPPIDHSCLSLMKENKSAFDESNYFCAEPFHTRNAKIVNTIVTERGDTLQENKEEYFDSTTNLDTFSCTTFNITTDVITMDQQDLQVENESATLLKDTLSQETTAAFNIDTIEDKLGNKTMLSDQSAYFSATPLSTNVFNIPEINETFTSSIAAANMQQSTEITSNTDNVLNDIDVINTIALNNEDNTEDLNCTNSSKMTDDKNNTVREINTEDEDTIEGPFLESEDLNILEKDLDSYDKKQDMMQFMDLNHAEVDENPEGGEIFIDAEAFEFLLNQNMTNVLSDCGKESLFLKFDPLFAKRVSSVGAGDSSPTKLQSIPDKPSTTNEQLPIAGPSSESMNILYSNDPLQDKTSESTSSTNKPTMVVTPAVNSVVPKNQTPCAPRSNRRSFTLTSPAIAVIDRLLSISGNNSLLGQDTTMFHNEEQETEQNFSTQIRELLAEKELQFHTMKAESSKLRDRLGDLESHVDKLEKEGQKRLSNINALNKELADKTKENRNMAAVVEEYERTIASLIAERVEENKKRDEERRQLIQERDEQIAHLSNMECSFNDLHSKYEKSKQTIIGFKVNEDAYKKTLKDFEENLAKMQNNYELLKQHATSKLNHANQELEKMNKMHAADVLKLKAMIKRKEMEITSLEESLTQKTKANDELTAICDELINKVG